MALQRYLPLLLLMMLNVHFSCSAQGYFFGTPLINNYDTEEFRGGIQSWQIVQDKREVMYVANNFGLVEFDGSVWNLHPVSNGTKVRSVHIGTDENIYVGSQADFGYFRPDYQGVLRYYSLADSLPQKYRNFDEVWRIYENGDRIYFLTFKNIFYYEGATNKVSIIEPPLPLEFSFFVNNQIYTLVWGAGLSVLVNDSLKLLTGGEFFANKQIASIIPYDKSRLLILTIRQGMYLYDGLSCTPFPVEDHPVLKSLIINQAVSLHDGVLAIGTQNNGLVLLSRDGHLAMHLTRENGLLDQTVHTLYEDVHHNLWLGLNNGISMVELSSPFSLIDNTMGVLGTGYAAIQDKENIYLGTNNGLFVLNTKNGGRHFKLVPRSLGQVYRLKKVGETILMGHHNGPYLIRNKEAELLSEAKGAWEFISLPNRSDDILMGTYNGLTLLRKEEEGINLVKHYSGFEESSRVLQFDDAGRLWMAHGYKGLFRLKFDSDYEHIQSIDFFNAKDGFPADQLINMERINHQLVFPALYGVYRYDEATNRFLVDKHLSEMFLPDEHIVKMEEDMAGNIYFISNRRVGKITFDKFRNATIDTRVFNKIWDKMNDDLGSIHILDANSILFDAKNGFIHYNASKTKVLKPFLTHLTSVINTAEEKDSLIVQGKAITELGDLNLPYRLNSIRFVYASSFYEDPDKTQYQYILKNFDKGWSDWTTKTDKEYTNLPEGSYQFYVRARNIYGTVSEAKAFTLVVNPPFYRSNWAYATYGLSSLLLLSLVFFQIDKRFKKEKKLILLKQERELVKKENELKEVTDKSEQEIVKLKNEKLQSEVDHMNRELTSSTIHLINKNELLNSVKRSLESILKGGTLEKDEESLRKIIHNIDNNLSTDGDWKQFELHFNNVHGNFTHRILEAYPKLTPQEIKLSAYLRLNLTTKEIAHLLNISVRGVEISRYRLRKKLNLERNENLTDFMLKF